VGLLLALGTLSWRQARVYRSVETLWTDTLQKNPNCRMAHNNLGTALLKKGSVDEAISHFQKALEIKADRAADRAEAHYNLGSALFQKGSVDEAIVHYQMALQIKPDYALAHINLGTDLLKKGSVDEAIAHFQNALQINPDNTEAHNGLGSALLQKGSVDEAITHFQKALQIKPNNAEAHYNLGNILLKKGSVDEAIVHYQTALQLKPNNLAAQNSLAWVLAIAPQASLRNGRQAVELAQQANQLAGGENPIILRTLAAAYAEAGRFPEAVATAQRALQLAETQSNTALASAIRSQLELYQAGTPFHLQ
jgi:superkiller protein 3